MRVTLDTNILVHAVDHRDPAKWAIAAEVFAILAARAAPLALQVVGEFQNAVVRRLRQPPSLAAAMASQLLASFATFAYDRGSVEAAVAMFATSRLSYWDALLVASVERAGIGVLLTEDMQDGARIGRVEIVNPFSRDGFSVRARAVLGL